MAITSLDIAQDNFTGDSNLISVHNPVVFLINATYSGAEPTYIDCIVKNSSGDTLNSFRCIPHQDILPTVRQFMFKADSILRGYMEDFSDFQQSNGSLEYVEGMTMEFTLNFQRYMEAGINLNIVCIHASRQIGEDPNAEDVYNNDSQTYYAQYGKPVYLYIYNNDESNSIGTSPGGGDDDILLDYDDVEFADFDDELLTANFENP